MTDDLSHRLELTARRALTQWDLEVDSLELVSRSENVVFRVNTQPGESYALRIHRPGYNTQAELESELLWTAALTAGGIRVPGHLHTRSGAGYASVVLEGTDQDHQVGVVEWLGGDSLASLIENAQSDVVAESFDQLGGLMALLHNISAAWPPPPGFERRHWDADGLAGSRPHWGCYWKVPQLSSAQAGLLERTRAYIHEALLDLGQDPSTYGVIHADLHPHNVLVDKGNVQVIDFDDAGFGWHHYDLAIALFHFHDDTRFGMITDALLNGYRRVRPLDPAVVALLPLFGLVRSLVSLAWINDRPELGLGDRAGRQALAVCEEAQAFLDQI